MKVIFLPLSLAVFPSVQAFAPHGAAPTKPSSTSLGVQRILARVIKNRIPEVFKNIHLPDNEPIPDKLLDVINLNLFSNLETVGYVLRAGGSDKLLGTPKTEGSLKDARQLVIDVADLTTTVPSPSKYKFFGSSENRAKELSLLLKTNPFMTSALTETSDGKGFELKSYDPNEKNPSRYLKFIRTLNTAGHKVNFKFNKKMEIESFEVYDDVEGVELKGNLDLNKYASSAIYNILFYASSVHATIHVLHFLLTSAFSVASRDFDEFHDWADEYEKNILIKYIEVGALLIKDAPGIGEKTLDLALITGRNGFGSSQELRPLLQDILNEWGSKPSVEGYMETMFNLSEATMNECGILTEYRKHIDLVKNFAKSASKALQDVDSKLFSESEKRLRSYLNDCGDFKSNIKSVSDWLEIMSVTGITHGSTLSYTRYMGVLDVVRWRNYLQPNWDEGDVNFVSGGLGTITGMEPGRHVMSSTTSGGRKGRYETELQKILDEYDIQTSALKEKYEKELLKNPDFNDFGFILSDFCTDNFDGKQLTITTYI